MCMHIHIISRITSHGIQPTKKCLAALSQYCTNIPMIIYDLKDTCYYRLLYRVHYAGTLCGESKTCICTMQSKRGRFQANARLTIFLKGGTVFRTVRLISYICPWMEFWKILKPTLWLNLSNGIGQKCDVSCDVSHQPTWAMWLVENLS